MDENGDSKSQPTPVNKNPQGVQTPPTQSVAQPSVQPSHAAPTSFQKQTASPADLRQQVDQFSSTNKPRKYFSKKVIFLFVIPLVVVVGMFIFITMQVGIDFIAQPKYLPDYLPAGLQQEGVKFEKNKNGENAYIVTYQVSSGGYLHFSQVFNPVDRECVKQPETNTRVKDYHDFLPTGNSTGCVHTTTFDDGNQSRYFRWMKDGIWFELTSFNYDISDDEALKFANSIQEQVNKTN